MSTFFSRLSRRELSTSAPVAAVCALTLLVGLTPGCGGGGGSTGTGASNNPSSTNRSTGTLTVSVRWPDASRLIPRAAQAIRVVVTATNNPTNTRTVVIASPGPGNSAARTIDNLLPTEYRIEAAAVPNVDGSGVAQAVASVTVTVVEKTNVNAPRLEMASTILSLRVRANRALPIQVGNEVVFSAEPRTNANGTGDIVLTAPSNLTWRVVSGNVTGVLRDNGSFAVTAAGTGDATVEVTDTEAGKTGTLTFGVNPATVQPPAIEPVTLVINGVEAEESEGYAISENGHVVGRGTFNGVQRPFRTHTDGTVEVLTVETGQANGVNSNGDVIGTMRSGNNRRAFLWKAGENSVLDLGFLNGQNTADTKNFSEGYAINDEGEMVGYAKDWCGCWRSFRTAPYSIIAKGDANDNDNDGFTFWGDDIGTIAPEVFKTFIHTLAYSINTKQQMAGISTNGQFVSNPDDPEAILNAGSITYQPFASPAEGSVPAEKVGRVGPESALGVVTGKPDAVARAINNQGDTAGWAGDLITLPATWTKEIAVIRLAGGALTKLPFLPGAAGSDTSRAYDINNAREVVGYAYKGGEQRAFLYREGVMTDLNTLLPENSGWVLLEARSINDRGQITGIGTKDGKKKAFVFALRP